MGRAAAIATGPQTSFPPGEALLRDAGTPLPLAQVTGAFKAAKAADVEEVLESLAAFQRAIPQESAGGMMWVVG